MLPALPALHCLPGAALLLPLPLACWRLDGLLAVVCWALITILLLSDFPPTRLPA
jgi:hypothetical protein